MRSPRGWQSWTPGKRLTGRRCWPGSGVDEPYSYSFAPRAVRDLEKLPEAVAAACVEFVAGVLRENPRRLGKPLEAMGRDELESGCATRFGWWARLVRTRVNSWSAVISQAPACRPHRAVRRGSSATHCVRPGGVAWARRFTCAQPHSLHLGHLVEHHPVRGAGAAGVAQVLRLRDMRFRDMVVTISGVRVSVGRGSAHSGCAGPPRSDCLSPAHSTRHQQRHPQRLCLIVGGLGGEVAGEGGCRNSVGACDAQCG